MLYYTFPPSLSQRNAVAEIADNELDQKRLEGQEVLYGSMLQLQHVYTGKYLSVNSSATSLLESTNLRVRAYGERGRWGRRGEGEGEEGRERGRGGEGEGERRGGRGGEEGRGEGERRERGEGEGERRGGRGEEGRREE